MRIRTKLTLWYSTVVGLTLIVFSLVLYTFLHYSMIQEIDRELAGRAAGVVRSIKIVEPNFLRPQQIVLPDVDVFGYPNTYLQVVDLHGRLVAKSSNLSHQNLPLSDNTLRIASKGQDFYEWLYVGKQKIRSYHYPLVARGQVVGLLQVGQPFSSIQAALTRLKWLLWLFSGFMILAAATIGWWLARAALKPVGEIAKTAELIRQSLNLNERIPHQGPQDELGRLATTLNTMLDSLEIAYRELEESHTAQRRFVSDVSHELKTPLTTIRGNIDLIKKMGEQYPKVRQEALADMASEAERMSRLVLDMLVLARADAGLSLPLQPVAIGQILGQVERQAKMLAGDKHFIINLEESCQNAQLQADTDYCRQLILILLDNAFKYTPPQGTVELSAKCSEKEVWLQVKDSGPGIPQEELKHIFARFYRSDKARPVGGTGLGLAIGQWIAQQHGARITVESELQKGSVFSVIFPRLYTEPSGN